MNGELITVTGASGGVGASTLAAALAWIAGGYRPCVLVDEDYLGGGLDIQAGIDHLSAARWGDVAAAPSDFDGAALLSSLPRTDRYALLAADGVAPEPAVAAAARAALIEQVQVVIVDRPRWLPGLVEAGRRIVVTGLTSRAVCDTQRLLQREPELVGVTELVTRSERGDGEVAAAVAEFLQVPLAAQLRDDQRIGSDVERGRPVGDRARSAVSQVADQLLQARTRGRHAVA